MGCGCGRARVRTVSQTAIKPKTVRAQVAPISLKRGMTRAMARKTCPKCGWPMSGSVRRYDPKTKVAVQVWVCTNRKKCNYKTEK